MTAPLAGSTRTVSGPRATQTEPAPTAMPGELASRSPLIGTENRFAIRPVAASRRTSPGPSSSLTQAPPAPVAMPPGSNGSLVDESTLCEERSTRATRR